MTNEKKPNPDQKRPASTQASGAGTKPGHEKKPEMDKKRDDRNKPSGQTKR